MHISEKALNIIEGGIGATHELKCSEAQSIIDQTKQFRATPALIEEARGLWANDDLEIDDDASQSPGSDDDGTWVQAWVWVPSKSMD